MSVEKFAQKKRRSDLPVSNIKQNLRSEKLDPTLKPSNLKEITYLTLFYNNPNVHAVFER